MNSTLKGMPDRLILSSLPAPKSIWTEIVFQTYWSSHTYTMGSLLSPCPPSMRFSGICPTFKFSSALSLYLPKASSGAQIHGAGSHAGPAHSEFVWPHIFPFIKYLLSPWSISGLRCGTTDKLYLLHVSGRQSSLVAVVKRIEKVESL